MTTDEYIKRLEEILDEQFKRLDGTTVLPIYNRPTAVGQAITAILALNNEAIGADEEPNMFDHNHPLWQVRELYKINRDGLRDELRAVIGLIK